MGANIGETATLNNKWLICFRPKPKDLQNLQAFKVKCLRCIQICTENRSLFAFFRHRTTKRATTPNTQGGQGNRYAEKAHTRRKIGTNTAGQPKETQGQTNRKKTGVVSTQKTSIWVMRFQKEEQLSKRNIRDVSLIKRRMAFDLRKRAVAKKAQLKENPIVTKKRHRQQENRQGPDNQL